LPRKWQVVSRPYILSTHEAPLPRDGRTAEIYTVTNLVSIRAGGASVKVRFTWKVTVMALRKWATQLYDFPPAAAASA
jgi:hypothetical protein